MQCTPPVRYRPWRFSPSLDCRSCLICALVFSETLSDPEVSSRLSALTSRTGSSGALKSGASFLLLLLLLLHPEAPLLVLYLVSSPFAPLSVPPFSHVSWAGSFSTFFNLICSLILSPFHVFQLVDVEVFDVLLLCVRSPSPVSASPTRSFPLRRSCLCVLFLIFWSISVLGSRTFHSSERGLCAVSRSLSFRKELRK